MVNIPFSTRNPVKKSSLGVEAKSLAFQVRDHLVCHVGCTCCRTMNEKDRHRDCTKSISEVQGDAQRRAGGVWY